MKVFEKISLTIFSIIILIISVLVMLIGFNILEQDLFETILEYVLDSEKLYITIGICILLIILAIKSLFFRSTDKVEKSSGILLENDNGKLLITKETIIDIVESVVKEYTETSNLMTKVNFDIENNIQVYITFSVEKGTIIKELSNKIQTKIKDTVKRSADLDISEINIKIKSIENNNTPVVS